MLELQDTALEVVTGGFGSMRIRISNSFNTVTNNGTANIAQVGNNNSAQVIYIKDVKLFL